MNDCPNAEVRDLLPDLLHDRLDAETRAMVEAHVDGCDDCASEVSLLRQVVVVTRRAPRLDLAAIASAVPAYRQPVRRSWVGWRTAAAITLMVAGGSSALVLRRNISPVTDTLPVPQGTSTAADPSALDSFAALPDRVVPVPAQVEPTLNVKVTRTPEPATPVPVAPVVAVSPPAKSVATSVAASQRVPAASRELALSSGPLNDLSDRELATLLKEIDRMDAVPSTDVDNSAISPIPPRRSTP